jgi:sterol desaturase/sphingolipid hydroxylase (fatty acid hydroxylase superfamily)
MGTVVSVVALAALMFAIERLRPGRALPQVQTWWLRVAFFNLAQIGVVFLAGTTWDRWLVGKRPWSLDHLGVVGSALVGYVTITFIYYWWHRARHSIPFLWRWLHQLHHSPERIEVVTSFYKHPLELLASGILSSVIVYLIVGLDVPAATLAVTITGVAEIFYHWNVRTPRWIGWLIPRPESHLIHHERNRHVFNYADLPIWDILFGTFKNPVSNDVLCGFDPPRELRLRAMLMGRDVNAR